MDEPQRERRITAGQCWRFPRGVLRLGDGRVLHPVPVADVTGTRVVRGWQGRDGTRVVLIVGDIGWGYRVEIYVDLSGRAPELAARDARELARLFLPEQVVALLDEIRGERGVAPAPQQLIDATVDYADIELDERPTPRWEFVGEEDRVVPGGLLALTRPILRLHRR